MTLKALIGANAGMFLITALAPAPIGRAIIDNFGLVPAAVLHQFSIWQPATYMFLHGGIFHLVFNMLALWMFGAELERKWGRPTSVLFGHWRRVPHRIGSDTPIWLRAANSALGRDRRVGGGYGLCSPGRFIPTAPSTCISCSRSRREFSSRLWAPSRFSHR
jgi:hypothetical protein